MNKELLKEALQVIEKTEIGEGDLTTEVVVPYPKFGGGEVTLKDEGIFAGRKIIELLFEPFCDELNVEWKLNDGAGIKEGDVAFSFQGKISHVLSRRRIVEYLIGRMSAIATNTRKLANLMESRGKKLVSPSRVVPGYEIFDNYAFRIGGGVVRAEGLKDSIYITKEHLKYGGNIENIIEHVIEEIGIARKKIKIEVEVSSFEEFQKANELDIDMLHLAEMSEEEILKIFEKGKPKKKPVLHLNSINDWSHKFDNLFFVYVSIENVYTEVAPMNCKVKIK